MYPVYLIGAGATPVAEHFERSAADLAVEALRLALVDAGSNFDPARIGALYVANAFGGALGSQLQLGAALADAAGLGSLEAVRIEAGGASGGLALRQALLAVAAGVYDLVLVLGVEKSTDRLEADLEQATALELDALAEADMGLTPTALWALLMQRYMYEFGYEADAFAPFPVNAHANAAANPGALYRFPITAEKYRRSGPVATPLSLLDCATFADGAAALLLAGETLAHELAAPRIQVAGSAVAVDRLALHSRRDPLHLAAAAQSAQAALRQAGRVHDEVDVLELSDPHGITAALALEAAGFVERGTAPRHAADGGIAPGGATPLATGGGTKARGDVGGAGGIYQICELYRQLRGAAGQSQVAAARTAFAQCLAGSGATAVSHVLLAER